jgi:glycosyltransferase involved in cell wall biosynthesis
MANSGRRILFDGTNAKSGGGFTYLVNIVPRLAAIAPADRLRVLVSSEAVARSIPPSPNLEIDLLPPVSWLRRLRVTHIDVGRVARSWGADLYFSAGEVAPVLVPCPTIASFRNPNLYTAIDQGWGWKQRIRMRILRGVSRLSARSCDRILFVSEDSARWIGDALSIPVERRAVVHHGIDPDAWKPPERPDPSRRHGHSSYILSVSSVYRYKNFVRLIEAYTALARRHDDMPDLLIIGDIVDEDYSEQMQRARDEAGELAMRIHLLGEVPYAEIKSYYAGAELFVFPSYLETFGHPLLEAMASGVPTVASDIPVFHEIAGDAVLYADPHDTESLASTMEEALFTPRVRERLRASARDRVGAFSWDRTARNLLALFDEVLSERAA